MINCCKQNGLCPNSFKNFDIEKYIDQMCPDIEANKQRVKDELDAFKRMDMMNLLKFTLFGNVYETEQDCMGCRQRQSRSKLCIVPFGSTQN